MKERNGSEMRDKERVREGIEEKEGGAWVGGVSIV